MTERKITNKTYPLLTMLKGLISFLIIGIIIGLSLKNAGLVLMLGVPAGSLLMLFILSKLDKGRILSVIIRSEVGGFGGFLAGFIIGELSGGAIGLIFPSLSDMSQIKSQIIPNIFVLIAADAIYGAILADLLYGRISVNTRSSSVTGSFLRCKLVNI